MSSNTNGDRRLRKDKKLFHKKGYVVGYTSSYRMGQILEHKVEFPSIPAKNDGNKHIVKVIDEIAQCLYDHHFTIEKENRQYGGTFIIGWIGRLYTIHSDYQYHQAIHPFHCIGSGEEYGLGAMLTAYKHSSDSDPTASIISALKAATEFNCHVAPPFHIINSTGYSKTYKN